MFVETLASGALRFIASAACAASMVAAACDHAVAAEPLPVVANSLGMKLLQVPAGEFFMGSTPEDIARLSETDEGPRDRFEGSVELTKSQGPRHRVTITKPFYLGMHEVTQREFAAVMGYNPSAHSPGGVARNRLGGRDTAEHPVESVSWGDAVEFCRQLSAFPDEIAAGRTYRLPTEAEWEYACRAGTTTSFYWGERAGKQVKEQREYVPLVDGAGKSTWPVGKKQPNPWGFHDMAGNVVEWCADWYGADEYRRATAVDPQGPATGTERVMRGTAVVWQAHRMRSAARRSAPPESVHAYRGFRVVCVVTPPKPVEPPPPSLAELEAKLRQKGLLRHGALFVLAEEAEFLRFVSTLERMRAACFTADRECREIETYLQAHDAAKAEAIKRRIAAREYVSYSDTWREHWNGVRAKHNATDLVRLINLSKDDILQWKRDADADRDAAVARLTEQLLNLRRRYEQLGERSLAAAADPDVSAVLAQINSSAGASVKVGRSAALAAAVKKLDAEEAALKKLTGA